MGDARTVKHFGLTPVDFFSPFRLISHEPPLEQLGRAINRQRKVCAIRFPSEARHAKSETGFNLVIFKCAVAAPDSLRILGPSGTSLEDWP
jgi:hypothetical protein